ncbi:thermostable hemolysin [Methylophaga sp.]|uniref:thermostable hemolysin n=1 Tax=Methylophaga sp. TaxID=2024840 RepID=UPI0013FEB84A|nr:thermostable hemolysin [Methylophaga sp.]MTI63841.1 hypothetical protein [Methylophaga sp.]
MEAVSFDNVLSDTGRNHRQTANWGLLPLYSLKLHTPDSHNRAAVEQFIYQRFAHQYAANISVFLPMLLSAADNKGITAALGFQPANLHRLFLEFYLDCDIETTLGLVTGGAVERQRIVEIGNLASGRQRATQSLFLLLAQILYESGYEWVVFTANSAVKAWLSRLQIPAFVLNDADPKRLPDKGANWGSYYDDKPVVLAANIDRSFSTMNSHPLMSHLRDQYANEIERFSARLPQ